MHDRNIPQEYDIEPPAASVRGVRDRGGRDDDRLL